MLNALVVSIICITFKMPINCCEINVAIYCRKLLLNIFVVTRKISKGILTVCNASKHIKHFSNYSKILVNKIIQVFVTVILILNLILVGMKLK